MTDAERQKLCKDLRADYYGDVADEIERFAIELKLVESENEHHIRLAFIDAGANPAVTWKQEAERLAESLKACHGYADECEAKIRFLCQQIDANLAQSLTSTLVN